MRLPDFSFEKKLHRQGYKLIAGVDEVGRGCFAGAVVAGCVVFGLDGVLPLGSPKAFPPANKLGAPSLGPPASRHPSVIINDSKRLSQKQREIADKWIRKNAYAFGIGLASVAQINKLGIKKATEIAFRKAIVNCKSTSSSAVKIDYLLIDAFYIPYVKGLRRKNQKAIVKGDALSISIAAASIIAKVYRDKLMTVLAKEPKFRKYKWHKNKGYGTTEHREIIRKHGATRLHRKQFVRSYVSSPAE
jgi:ribonuclease HII